MTRPALFEGQRTDDPSSQKPSSVTGLARGALSLLTLSVACLLGACADVPSDGAAGTAAESRAGSQTSDLYLNSGPTWANATVPVCWVNPQDATAMAWVRDAVVNTWGTYSGLRFTGWGTCGTTATTEVRIQNAFVRPNSIIGPFATSSYTMQLNPWIDQHPDFGGCAGFREYCIRGAAVHEFGHALGFRHEQDRPDNGGRCADSIDATGSGILLGPYDPKSVMNYCNPALFDGTLSAGDIGGVQAVYGRPAGRPPTRDLQVAAQTFRMSVFGDITEVGTERLRQAPLLNAPLAKRMRQTGVNVGYILDGHGDLHGYHLAGGTPPLPVAGTPHWSYDIARDFVMTGSSSGYILDGQGGIHPFGGAPVAKFDGYWTYDIARAFVLLPDRSGGYVLDGKGGFHGWAVDGKPMPRPTNGGAYWPTTAPARAIALTPDAIGGWILTDAGTVHPFGIDGHVPPRATAALGSDAFALDVSTQTDTVRLTAVNGVGNVQSGQVPLNVLRHIASGVRAGVRVSYALYAFGNLKPLDGSPDLGVRAGWDWAIARKAVLRADGASGYVLDGWGGVHPFGGAPAPIGFAYWQGWDIARDLKLLGDGPSGYTLDGFGGIQPFGGAPPVSGGGYWPGRDIAKAIVLRRDGRGGYQLDGQGGIHAFTAQGQPAVPAVQSPPYWSWDIARDFVLGSDELGGYILDGFGGIHAYVLAGGAERRALGTSCYSPGNDNAVALALFSDGLSGRMGLRSNFVCQVFPQ